MSVPHDEHLQGWVGPGCSAHARQHSTPLPAISSNCTTRHPRSAVLPITGKGVHAVDESCRRHGPATAVQADLVEAVDAAGFQGLVVGSADLEQVDQQLLVRITGMTCSSCSTAVEKALQAVPGVRSAAVSLVQSRAEVRPSLPGSCSWAVWCNVWGRVQGLGPAVKVQLQDCAVWSEEAVQGLPGGAACRAQGQALVLPCADAWISLCEVNL